MAHSDAYERGAQAVGEVLEETIAEGGDLAQAMHNIGTDIMNEMAGLDPEDPNYERDCDHYRGMLSRLDA
jgi:hypothetical protein